MKTSRFTDSQIIEWRGQPKVLCCDNGPEYVSMALEQWAEKRNIK